MADGGMSPHFSVPNGTTVAIAVPDVSLFLSASFVWATQQVASNRKVKTEVVRRIVPSKRSFSKLSGSGHEHERAATRGRFFHEPALVFHIFDRPGLSQIPRAVRLFRAKARLSGF